MIAACLRSVKNFPYALLLTGALLFLTLTGCSDETSGAEALPDLSAPDLAPAAPRHNIHGNVALKVEAQGVGVFAQNGVFAYIPKAEIVGKQVAWVILKGGDQIGNGKMLEVGGGVIDDNVGFDFTTKLGYVDGPWELSLLILLKTTDLSMAPQPGDLASFDLTKAPAGEPPITGTSVRVSIHGADANVNLINRHFIKL